MFIFSSPAILSACGEDVEYPMQSAFVQATLYSEGEFQAGASRMLTFQSSLEAGDDGSYRDDYEISLQGRLRTSEADWVKDNCGPLVYWKFEGATAENYIVEFYEGLPLRTEADVDAFFEDALKKQTVEPNGENSMPPADSQPDEPLWKVRFDTIMEPLASKVRLGEGASTVTALAYFAEQLDKDYAVWFALNDLEEPMKAAEVLQYLNDFGDRMLRTHLQQHKPKCLVD